MINKIIRNFLAKQVAGRSDDGIMITLRDPQKVELLENIMADLLMRNGIDPRAITSEAQLKTILNQIEAMTKQSTTSGIRNTESAKIFEIATGKEIPKGSKIMGGQAVDDMPPPGSRGGSDDIAAPVQSSEETLKNMIEAENKKGIAKIKQRQKMLDDAIEDASPGFANDIKYDAELVAENLAERMGLVYDDLPTKQRLDIYDKAYTGLSKKRFKQRQSLEDFVDDAGGVDESDPRGIDDFIPEPEDKATGGRVGYSIGDRVIPNNDFINLSLGNMTQGQNTQTAGLLDLFKDTPEEQALEQIQDLRKQENQIKNLGEGAIELKKDELQDIQQQIQDLKNQYPEDESIQQAFDPYADIQGQTAFLDPFTVIGGLIKVGKGAKASALAKQFLKNKAKQKITKDIYDKVQKKIKTPKYPTTPPIITGGGGADSGGGYTPTTTAQNVSRTSSRVDSSGNVKAYGLKDGGIMRLGFKDGMNRRTFLKLFTGLVSLPIIGKVLKPLKVGKTVTKVPIIKTDNVAGKPEWFDQLVNKVILEGDDVTKRFATKEREIVHMKKLDEDTTVRVTQDLDEGAVKVDYENPENVYGDPVQLRYKKPNPDEGDPRPSAEFDTAESGPVGRAFGPDDYEIEIDELGGTSISDLTSDVSKLKEYATGQKPTLKEIVQSKKRKDKAARISEGGEDEMQAVIDRQGEFIQFDDVYPEQDFAKGGIARMLGE